MAGPAVRHALLPRVRDLFLLLVVLVHVVEGLEWLDATTPLWPHRVIAALALAAGVAWGVGLRRWARPHVLLDLVLFASIVGAGLGLGRPGAVIAMLVGVSQLRALYGTRRSAAAATVGVVAAYGLVTFLLAGLDGLLDLGVVVVAVGVGALALVIRLVGEAMASHDVAAAWESVLTSAAEELVGATEPADVERVVETSLAELERGAPRAGGGLWDATIPVGAVPSTCEELDDVVRRDELAEVAPRLAQVLRRLDGDRALARDRVLSEQRFRVLAEESHDAIYVLEMWPTVRWRYLNPAAEALLGVSADAAAADPNAVFARIHPDDRSLLLTAGEDGVVDEAVRFRVVRAPDQQVTWLELHEIVLERKDGRPRVVQGVARDVTRQWNEETALRRALEQQEAAARDLRTLDEMKSMFLRAVSHELRTPLTAVLGASITLRRRRELTEEQVDELLAAIHRQAGRLERLLEDLLDVDRLSRGIIEPERAPTDVAALVDRVVDAAEEDSHPVSVTGAGVVVELDAAKVERIIDNLLRNARTHTPAGTSIRVRVDGDATGAVLTVEDDGPGVPPELRHRIFEPFAQGAHTNEIASPGTGIGLALVSKLAELHGGHVWVEQAASGGARFVVTLPAVTPGTPRAPVLRPGELARD